MKDLKGQRFGMLTVMYKEPAWRVRCDCGGTRIVLGKYLMNGDTTTCGCKSQELRSDKRRTHGHSRSIAYRAWTSAKQRCYNPNLALYGNYGGRGIAMCNRWKDSFPNFLIDMGECPPGLSLDRIDVNGDYEPGNCRWATLSDQLRNKTTNVILAFLGQKKCRADWVRDLGITEKLLTNEIAREGVENGITRCILMRAFGIRRTSGGFRHYELVA